MKIRTGYSFRSAVGHLEDVIARLKEIGSATAPISDTASTFAYVKWDKLARKAGLRPVFGVELAVTPSINDKKPTADHWAFFATDNLAPLHQLIEVATRQFRYQPLLTYQQAIEAKGLIKITGHRPQLSLVPLQPDIYVPYGPSSSVGLVREALRLGHQLIATSDNRYVRKGEEAFYEVVCGRNASTQTYPQWIMDDQEWAESVRPQDQEFMQSALANRTLVLERCQAKLRQGSLLHPEHCKSLRDMCIEGAEKLRANLSDPVYAARLDRELDLIQQKKFEDYFFIIADMVTWARERMLVGPARGSSCGSLVCYLLGITTVDPIPYRLIFERFIDINRGDLPDIDIDFSDTQRDKVFAYMEHKYGAERVARLGTVAMFKPRSSLKEISGALDIPPWELNPVVDSLIQRSGGDSRALQTMEDTFTGTEAGRTFIKKYPGAAIAQKMEGHPRHYSQHAAGIIVTEEPVHNYVARDARTGATFCDKKDAEELNLLKIDALGLTQLSIFEQTLELAGKPLSLINAIPLDDPLALDVLNKHHFAGVFQFNGLALQSLAKQIKFESLEDVISVTALARPGPLASGGANEWVKRRTGKKSVTFPHEAFRPYLETSLGIVAYQEQVMEIGRHIGNLSWEDVSAVRKAMSKSLGKEYFDQYGDRWKSGAAKLGLPQQTLDKIWDDLCAYGSWSFNRSHAVAYGIISYQCAWLKAHYPLEFAAATLEHEKLPGRQLITLREMAEEGIQYLPVDAELSTDHWTTGIKGNEKFLVGPLQNVRGLGPKLVQQIMSAKARNEPMPARAQKLLANPKTEIDDLWPIKNAVKRLLPNPAERQIYTLPVNLVDLQITGAQKADVLVYVVLSKIAPRDENEAVNVARRGGKLISGPTTSLNLQLTDDTDTILAKINRLDYAAIGKDLVERGKIGKAVYAMKGTLFSNFRMLGVKKVRYLGDIE